MSIEKRIINYILETGTRDNFYEVVLGATHRFPGYSSSTLLELTKEVYNLKGWRQDRETALPALLMSREARLEDWDRYLAGELEKVTTKKYKPSKKPDVYLNANDQILKEKLDNCR